MNLFTFLQSLDPEISPNETKIHLAVWNGQVDPLDTFVDGEFEEWQSWQTRKNFQRDFVVSLIALPGRSRWLFAGCFDSESVQWRQRSERFNYNLTERKGAESFVGRLIVEFERTGRQSYLRADNWLEEMKLAEILAEKFQVPEFPGFQWIFIDKAKLDRVVFNDVSSWRSALSSVGGVYLITDKATGRKYVGSATGEYGFWGRWCEYSKDGHGSNKELRALLGQKGAEYATNFQYSILETADSRSAPEYVLEREGH